MTPITPKQAEAQAHKIFYDITGMEISISIAKAIKQILALKERTDNA